MDMMLQSGQNRDFSEFRRESKKVIRYTRDNFWSFGGKTTTYRHVTGIIQNTDQSVSPGTSDRGCRQ